MLYAAIDTNVFVAALLSKHEDSATVLLVKQFVSGKLGLVYDERIFDEYKSVLQRPKFKFPLNDQNYLLSAVKKYGLMIYPKSTNEILADKKDLPFYEVCMANEEFYLVTGNKKHFPTKKFIVTPREMLDILANVEYNEGEQS